MQKLIARVALFRKGVEKFEKEVNKHLDEGYSIDALSIEKHGLRILCYALVVQKNENATEVVPIETVL